MPHTVRPAAAPLIWNRPNLRFLEGAPAGAAPAAPASPPAPAAPAPAPATGSEPTAPAPVEPDPAGSEHLGDAGKQALDRMKQERNEARDSLKAFKDLGVTAEQVQQLLSRDADSAQEAAITQARTAAEQEATTRLHAKLREFSIAATAAQLNFYDPADALTQLKPEQIEAIEVSATDDVDAAAVTALLEQIAKDKPYLVKQTTADHTWAGIGSMGSGVSPADAAQPGYDRMRAAYAQSTKQ